ncbi:MAG TPA: NAD-dependent epimerase/dehydratase family protein [Thiotrichaceae bacterium]|jgi:UDP-glucuronate decarboxylase|nr:NAD-dependent epimerase/dehydratase family protein [Thiotrichaceae bacterium]
MNTFLLMTDVDEIIEQLDEITADYDGKTILLAGGLGFLGRYFMSVFARLNETKFSEPCKLIILDNLITSGKASNYIDQYPEFKFLEQDITTPLNIDEHIDFVIHCAGIASPFYYRAHPLETADVAIAGNRNLLEVAKSNQARYTFFSSSEIYGDPDPKHIPTPESYRGNVSSQGPRACYDESKRMGETLCYIYNHLHGTATTIIRPFNVYGPGMQEADYRVLPNFASLIKAGKPLKVYGGGNQTRTFCYVTDAINGFLRAIAKGVPGETYNIGNPKPEISMVELVQHCSDAIGKKIDHNIIEYPDSYPADEPNRRCPDIRKAKLQLEYVPNVDLKTGLQRFLSWTDDNFVGEQ